MSSSTMLSGRDRPAMPERTQSMDWFGEPWPDADRRAEVCSNEEYHQPVPLGITCMICGTTFVSSDRGILFPMALDRDGWTATHLACFTAMIAGKKGHHR